MGYSIEYDKYGEPDKVGPIEVTNHVFADGSGAVVSQRLHTIRYSYNGFGGALGEAAVHADDNDWEGIGVFLDHSGEPVAMDRSVEDWFKPTDYSHVCELARDQANAETIRSAVAAAADKDRAHVGEDCGEDAYTEVDGYLFFDLGAENIVFTLLEIQKSMSGYSILNEERVTELEDEALTRHIEDEVGQLDLDGDVDTSEIEDVYRGFADTMCPDCSPVEITDVLDECEITECGECGTLHYTEDSMKSMDGEDNQLCPDCANGVREELDKAHEVVKEYLDWDLCNGYGAKIRFNGEVYRWDGMEWRPTTLLPNEHCVNEVKW